jgi:transposase
MAPTTPPLDFIHEKGFEIPTKHKEAIRQLHRFAKISVPALQIRYDLGESTIRRILEYDIPERARPTRTGRPQLLTDRRVDKIIEYCAESWEHRILKYELLIEELQLPCTPEHLQVRLKQRGYFRCTAC